MRFVVQIAMPVAKKSGSSVHSTHPNPMPEAKPGQSCSERPRWRATLYFQLRRRFLVTGSMISRTASSQRRTNRFSRYRFSPAKTVFRSRLKSSRSYCAVIFLVFT
jgi:hypothetical protein